MHEERKKAIKRKIHKVLSGVNLSDENMFCEQFSNYMDELYHLMAKENEFNLISQKDLTNIVLGGIVKEQYESKEENKKPSKSHIEKKIAEVIFSIPIKYTIKLNSPIFNGEYLFNSEVLCIPFSLNNIRPKKTGLFEEFLKNANKKEPNKVNDLTFEINGYLNYTSNRTSRKCISLIKIFIQRALSNELYVLRENSNEERIKDISSGLFAVQNLKSIPEYFLEYKSNQEADERFKKINLNDEFSYFIDRLDVNLNNKALKDGLEDNDFGFLSKTIEETKLLINKEEANVINIASAIQWYLDACIYEDKNLSFSFLQICFGLEALFSDDPKLISKTLSLKCAYSIGRSNDDRSKIIKLIKKIYELRSQIVHGSKLCIEEDEEKIFKQGKMILKISIGNELELAMKNKTKI